MQNRMRQQQQQQAIILQSMLQQQQQQQQQQAIIQQSMLQQQPPMFHPALLGAPQVCREYSSQVSESLLQEVFMSTGPIEGCKLIRKEKSSYGFVDYYDRRSAGLAIITLNGRNLFGQPIKVNWAYASSQREGTSNHFNIFVGDLSPEVADATFSLFILHARLMTKIIIVLQRCKSYVGPEDGPIEGIWVCLFPQPTGKWLGSRQIRCNWGAKGAGASEDKQSFDSKSVVELTNGTSGHEKTSNYTAENSSQLTTVYVGNLAPEVASVDLHCHFHALSAGAIEDVRVQRDKGFGFVRYSSHAEAARAIQLGNARMLFGKQLKCSWGSKPTPPGTSSTPLAPPAAQPGLAAAYERQLAVSRMAGAQVMMQPQRQLPLNSAAMAMGAAGASHAASYDGGLQNAATSQQLMYNNR
ncbi:Oligouridylate-binding protein 1-like protein [Drosera capensis]